MTTRILSLLIAGVTALAVPTGAAMAASADPDHPDLTGFWEIPYTPIPPQRQATPFEQEMIDALPAGTLLLADSGLKEFPPGDFGGLKVTNAARDHAAKYDIESQRDAATTCEPPSIIYAMQGPFPMEIFQGRDMVVIKMEYYDQVRIIPIDPKNDPDDWPDSTVGHSVGHWDGDTLVVRTNHISAATMLNNGLDHSNHMQLTENIRLSPDGKTLAIMQIYEDPEVFEGRAARIIPLHRRDDHVYPYACDPSYGVAVEEREKK